MRQAKQKVHAALVGLCAVLALCAGPLTATSSAQILETRALGVARGGHTATQLSDGRILIVGGENATGLVADSELFDPTSRTFSPGSLLAAPRTDHTATLLPDGRVLVAGGSDQNGPTTSTEVFDPVTGAFSAGPSMQGVRAGHSATALADGRLLLAGGDAAGSAEIFDPQTQAFLSIAAGLTAPRAFHAATRLQDGRVLIVGGVGAASDPLSSAEIFDPTAGTFVAVNHDMAVARSLPALKVLPDGKVQVIGGDLDGSMEIFDPNGEFFNARAILPPETALLDETLSTQSRAALIRPQVHGGLSPELYDLMNRQDHSVTEMSQTNQALVAGGVAGGQVLTSAVLVKSSSAAVTTDKTDYAPGQVVTINGTGWQPGETVLLVLHEDPTAEPDHIFSASVDSGGRFTAIDFAPDANDVGRTFTLTVIGQTSGFVAQTVFTDAELVTAELTGIMNDVTIVQGASPTGFTISVTATGNVSCAQTSLNPSTATAKTVYSFTAGTLSSSTPSSALNFFTSCSGSNGPVTWTGAPTPYTVAATVSADATTPANNYAVTLSSLAGTTSLTNPNTTQGKLEDASATLITVHVRLAAPSGLTATGVSQSQINLSWTDNSTGEDNFAIEVSTNGGGSFSPLATVGAGITTFNHTGLTCGTTRHYRVRATKTSPTGLNSDFSDVANGTTVTCNTAPTASAGGPYAVPEGGSVALAGSGSDPDPSDTLTYTWDLDNNGTFETSGQNPTFSAAGRDGPGAQTVVLKVCDSQSACTTANGTVNITNAPPTATLANNGPVAEGSPATVSFSNQFDPSTADTAAGFHYAFACDNGSLAAATYGGSGTTDSTACTFDDNGSYPVKGRIIDKDGGFNEYTTTVTVNNAPPTATLANNGPVAEGSPATVSFSNQSDPSTADTAAGFHYAYSCTNGDLSGATYGGSGTSASTTCTFDDGPATKTVKARIIDKDGGATEYTTVLQVTNVAPTITGVTPSANVLIGQPVTFTGAATDPSNADTSHGFHWAWSTGSGFGPFGTDHNNTFVTTYFACGTYTVQAEAQDKDEGISAPFTSSPVSVWNGTFLPPLKEGAANLVQKGRVLPVQISFGCGGHRSGLAPEIQLLFGDFVANAGTETSYENLVTESVSNADTTGVMREVDSKYLYNLAIPNNPSWKAGQALTVRVRPFGPLTSPTMYILLEIRK